MQRKCKTQGFFPSNWAWLIWAILVVTPSYAASVYRCGSAYSTSTLCAEGDAVEINTRATAPQSATSKASPALSDWKEAEALEKKRLASENRAGKQTIPHVIATTPSTEPLPAQNKRHTQTPYFTAKDPNAPAKKKGNAKALPPATN